MQGARASHADHQHPGACGEARQIDHRQLQPLEAAISAMNTEQAALLRWAGIPSRSYQLD